MLIGAGIGITPFASILQSIMHRSVLCRELGLGWVPPSQTVGTGPRTGSPLGANLRPGGFRPGTCYGAVGWGAWGLCALCGVRGMPGGLQGCATRAGTA